MNKLVNRIKLLLAFLTRRTKTSGFPIEVGIEVINQCNLNCIMCPYSQMVSNKTRPVGKMRFPLFKKIIDEITPFVELIYLHGLGEPFLHPRIFEFIDYAKTKKVKVGLSTNATLLDQTKSQKLLNSGLDYLILAVDGATKKTYEKIRVGGDFEKVEKNIKDFLTMKKRKSTLQLLGKTPFVVIQFITMEENEKEADLFLKKWQGKGANVIRVKPKISLKDEDKKGRFKITGYCFHLFRQLNIYWDGTVVPCCEDVHGRCPLGNVKKEPFKMIWHNKKMEHLRKINFSGQREKVPLCQNCLYPQPTVLEAIGVMILDQLKVKKILPWIEKWQR